MVDDLGRRFARKAKKVQPQTENEKVADESAIASLKNRVSERKIKVYKLRDLQETRFLTRFI
jgi:hypothetical protein